MPQRVFEGSAAAFTAYHRVAKKSGLPLTICWWSNDL